MPRDGTFSKLRHAPEKSKLLSREDPGHLPTSPAIAPMRIVSTAHLRQTSFTIRSAWNNRHSLNGSQIHKVKMLATTCAPLIRAIRAQRITHPTRRRKRQQFRPFGSLCEQKNGACAGRIRKTLIMKRGGPEGTPLRLPGQNRITTKQPT